MNRPITTLLKKGEYDIKIYHMNKNGNSSLFN